MTTTMRTTPTSSAAAATMVRTMRTMAAATRLRDGSGSGDSSRDEVKPSHGEARGRGRLCMQRESGSTCRTARGGQACPWKVGSKGREPSHPAPLVRLVLLELLVLLALLLLALLPSMVRRVGRSCRCRRPPALLSTHLRCRSGCVRCCTGSRSCSGQLLVCSVAAAAPTASAVVLLLRPVAVVGSPATRTRRQGIRCRKLTRRVCRTGTVCVLAARGACLYGACAGSSAACGGACGARCAHNAGRAFARPQCTSMTSTSGTWTSRVPLAMLARAPGAYCACCRQLHGRMRWCGE